MRNKLTPCLRPDQYTTNKVKPEPKREFRGVWVATVVNIDWPSEGHVSAETSKNKN